MKQNRSFHLVCSALVFACLLGDPVDIQADTTLVTFTETGSHTFKVKGQKVLILQSGESALPQSILYDRPRREMTLLDHQKKTFLLIEATKLEKLGTKVHDVLDEVDERLSLLGGEAEQEALRGLLRGVLSELGKDGGKHSEKAFVMRDRTSRISRWDCKVLDRKADGKRDATFYLVDRKTLGISKSDHKTLVSLESFTNDLLSALPAGESIRQAIGPPDLYFPEGQIPVRTITYAEQEKITSQLGEVSLDELDQREFAIPEGYTEEKIDLPF